MTEILGNASMRNILTTAQRVERDIADTSLRLATGRRVNKAIDNPESFFLSQSLSTRASDFIRLLDGINLGVKTIQQTLNGVESIDGLLKQARAIADQSLTLALAGETDPNVYTTGVPATVGDLSTVILADNPAGYWRLNELGGGTAGNSGSGGGINGTYVNGVSLNQPSLFETGSASADFNGVNQRVDLPNSALINTATYNERTVELVFNADTVTGRQVLYEEGATVNSFGIYIDNGRIYTVGRDQGSWGPSNISAPINPNQTYHVSFVFDRASNSFTGYLDGAPIGSVPVANTTFPSHSGAVAIGSMRGGMWFHDGAQGGDNHYFDGQISDVALYNTALTQADMEERVTAMSVNGLNYLNRQYETVMSEIRQIINDTHITNINLLGGDNLITWLNEDFSHSLTTRGIDATPEGLGVLNQDFEGVGNIRQIIDSIGDGRKRLARYGETLTSNLQILSGRKEFTNTIVANHKSGSGDLVLADLQEEGAQLLALQTKQQLATTSLSLAGLNQARTLRLFVSTE